MAPPPLYRQFLGHRPRSASAEPRPASPSDAAVPDNTEAAHHLKITAVSLDPDPADGRPG